MVLIYLCIWQLFLCISYTQGIDVIENYLLIYQLLLLTPNLTCLSIQ